MSSNEQPLAWIVSRGATVLHFSAADGWDVQAVMYGTPEGHAYGQPVPRAQVEALKQGVRDLLIRYSPKVHDGYWVMLRDAMDKLLGDPPTAGALELTDTLRMEFLCTLEGQYFMSKLVAGLTPEQVRNCVDSELQRRHHG